MEKKEHIWLSPLKLNGNRTLPHRLMQGPMLGIMNPLYFQTVNKLNLVDYWITPFIGISNSVPSMSVLKKNLNKYLNSDKPFIVQLLSHNSMAISNTVKKLSELPISGINLNFACPSPTVLSSNSGAKLLSRPEEMLRIIDSIREKTPDISISLKLRTGLSSPSEMKNTIPRLAASGVDFIMLHYRTASERYKIIENGQQRIKEAVELAENKAPLIASGDIFSLSSAQKMYNKSKCQGIVVARGMFTEPFLLREIEANLSGKSLNLSDAPKVIFSRELSKTASEHPELYNRPSFLSLIRAIWGENHEHFRSILKLDNKELLYYF